VSDASSDNVTVKALLKAFSERRIVRVAMMLCLGFVTLGTHAAEPDTFGAQASLATLDSFAIPELGNLIDAYVADQITYDDNLYRLPNGITNVEALIGPNASRQDHINTASLGTSDQWIYSGQAVGVKAQADDNRYSRNTDLDNLSGNAKGVWDWRAGRSWLGELGADFTRSLAGAANSKFFSRDLVNQSEYFGTALFGVGAHWNLIAGLRYADNTHSAVARQFEDFHRKTENLGVEYLTLSDDTIALEYRHTQGDFPQSIILDGLVFDQDYTEQSGRLLFRYAFTPKVLLDGSVGYLKRDYPDSTIGSFEGTIWRAYIQWQISEKTQVLVAGWRELTSYIDSESDFFVARGESISPTWNPTERISLSLMYSSIHQNYISYNTDATDSVGIAGSRSDKVESQQAIFLYKPRDAWVVKLTYGIEHRESTKQEFQYDDKLATANFNYRFGRPLEPLQH
jgi:hypothetical protein